MKQYLLLLALLGCVEHKDGITGTQSIKVDVVTPTNLGSEASRLPDTQRTVVVNLTAIDADGNEDVTFNADVSVYVLYLGTLTPYLGETPLATIHMTNGKAVNQTVMLPPVFGPTTLWFDDGKSADPTFATGASEPLWYRDPFIKDLQTPANEMGLDALSVSPLQDKQVRVDQSAFGANGRLVVTSVFAQGYTVSDVQCGPGGAPPCTTLPYHHAMVFTFSAARDNHGRFIKEGQTITGFGGGVQEFNGLTEIGFPQTFVEDPDGEVNAARLPAPAIVDPATWFTTMKWLFEQNEAAPIAAENFEVCALDADYMTYKQWKLAPAGTCMPGNRNVLNVITTGVTSLDPGKCVGKVLPRVVGVLRPVNIGSFNVWIIYPRGNADLTLPAGDATCKL